MTSSSTQDSWKKESDLKTTEKRRRQALLTVGIVSDKVIESFCLASMPIKKKLIYKRKLLRLVQVQ